MHWRLFNGILHAGLLHATSVRSLLATKSGRILDLITAVKWLASGLHQLYFGLALSFCFGFPLSLSLGELFPQGDCHRASVSL